MCVSIHVYTCICINIHMYTYTYRALLAEHSLFWHTSLCPLIYLYIYIYIYMFIYICIYMYTQNTDFFWQNTASFDTHPFVLESIYIYIYIQVHIHMYKCIYRIQGSFGRTQPLLTHIPLPFLEGYIYI